MWLGGRRCKNEILWQSSKQFTLLPTRALQMPSGHECLALSGQVGMKDNWSFYIFPKSKSRPFCEYVCKFSMWRGWQSSPVLPEPVTPVCQLSPWSLSAISWLSKPAQESHRLSRPAWITMPLMEFLAICVAVIKGALLRHLLWRFINENGLIREWYNVVRCKAHVGVFVPLLSVF